MFLEGVLLKREMQYLPISLLTYREMLFEMMMSDAIWTITLFTNWARSEVTKSKCEWTRIWTIYLDDVDETNLWAFFFWEKGPLPVLCNFRVQVLEFDMTSVLFLMLTLSEPGWFGGVGWGPPPHGEVTALLPPPESPSGCVSGPMVGEEAEVSIWNKEISLS